MTNYLDCKVDNVGFNSRHVQPALVGHEDFTHYVVDGKQIFHVTVDNGIRNLRCFVNVSGLRE